MKILCSILLFPLICLACTSNADNKAKVQDAVVIDTTANNTAAAISAQLFKDSFIKEFSNFDAIGKLRTIEYMNTPAKISDGVSNIKDLASLISRADTCHDKTVQTMRVQAKSKLLSYQKKAFPLMRNAYFQYIKSALWKADIEVELTGANKTVLTFIGAAYAANMRKQQTMDSIDDMVKLLRFKLVNIKWIRHDDNYTYWKIDSPSDIAFN